MKARLALLGLVIAASVRAAPAVDSAPPAPFHAEYLALRNGDQLGRTTLDLSDNHDGTWTLRSDTRGTSGLAKLAGVHIVETSHFRWHDGRPEAIEYDYKQDSAVKSRTRHAVFGGGEAHVEEGGETFRYALVPGLVDRHAVTLALANDLMYGARSFEYKVAVKDHVEDMSYERAGDEQLKVPAGTFDAVLMRRAGETGSDRKRVARSWFSEKLGWMPIQIEQEDKKDTITLQLAALPKR
ncbi:MAG TPA: DUF3108 domain-containing protein [Rhodanobacteraceae bacterium]|jgi:hypothetical protein|nr:DUF3108 domain-containing protein [Rhodanobacteraceae bacterium]